MHIRKSERVHARGWLSASRTHQLCKPTPLANGGGKGGARRVTRGGGLTHRELGAQLERDRVHDGQLDLVHTKGGVCGERLHVRTEKDLRLEQGLPPLHIVC